MNEYISRQDVASALATIRLKAMEEGKNVDNIVECEFAILQVKAIKDYDTFAMETFDVGYHAGYKKAYEKVSGYWIRTSNVSPVWKCSECGSQLNIYFPYDYCPFCGANMKDSTRNIIESMTERGKE